MARATTFRPHLTALEDRANPVTAVFNSFTHVLTVTGTEGRDVVHLSVADGNILLNGAAIAGNPTVTTTDTITIATGDNIEHNDDGGISGTGSPDYVNLDWSGGAFAPGYSAEPTGLSEIEITMDPGRFRPYLFILWEDLLHLRGGAADDQIDIGRARGAERINLNGDNDVDFSVLDYSDVPSAVNGTRIKVFAGAGDDRVNAAGGPVVGAAYTGYNLLGTPDTGLEIEGSTGNDVLIGGAKDTRIDGGPGDDQVIGGPSWDALFGEDGNDYLSGGPGSDLLVGDPQFPAPRSVGGDDILIGGDDPDSLFGHAGNDWLLGGGGDDELVGGAGSDHLFGQAGDDRLDGGAGNDTLSGGVGNDNLKGGTGDDSLNGNTGTDVLQGEAGNDILDGGADSAVDILIGGAGSDGFRFQVGEIFLSDFDPFDPDNLLP
jgi:Ca2+-binding RTX toxin-like protein